MIKSPVLTNKGYFKGYGIDEFGSVYSKKRNDEWKKMKCKITKKGYVEVSLVKKKKSHFFRVHRLVLMNFGDENVDFSLKVNHIDGNKLNNHISNLEWCTDKENMRHAMRTGLWRRDMAHHEPKFGEENPTCVFSDDNVFSIIDDIMSNNYSDAEIAERHNCSKSTVSHIRTGRLRSREMKRYLKTHNLEKGPTTRSKRISRLHVRFL